MKTTYKLLLPALLLSGSAYAAEITSMGYPDSPPVNYGLTLSTEQQSGIEFITGGIGDEETAQLESLASDYNTKITNARKGGGAYVGDTDLMIYNTRGERLLATDVGPLTYANLPRGKYKITAENNGRLQTKTISAGSRNNIQFIW